jgi:signal transduction histidine kinase
MTETRRANLRHAVRVAATATAVVALVYLLAVAIFDVIVVNHLYEQADNRLHARLMDVTQQPEGPLTVPSGSDHVAVKPSTGGDLDDAPVFLWVLGPSARTLASSAGAPALPARSWSKSGGETTVTLRHSAFRLSSARFHGGWVVAGVSLANERHLQGIVIGAEVIAGPIALLGMFLGSLVIGLKASAPVERARRRQLEFTADASHELRTPLTVIEAEVDLALHGTRDAAGYRESLERVREESGRLSHIVDDLLWLARLDSNPPPPTREPVDLATIAQTCADRFQSLAVSRLISLSAESRGQGLPWVNAPAEWIDRLAGVLVDNACRYSPPGGTVLVVVEARTGRVSLAVEDSGPGIPPEERPRMFDRFHRSSDVPGGTGLGLAIADSIVRSTDGRWHIGESALGGALIEVTWHRPSPRGRGYGPDTRAEPSVPAREEPGADLPEKKQAERDAEGDARHERPLSGAGTGDVAPGPAKPIERGQAGGVDHMTEHVHGHGAEPQHEAGFVHEQHVVSEP